jgi:tRNA A37 threonylcarbamoyladenosine modification protein TsaB
MQGLATGLAKPCLGLSVLDVLASLVPDRPMVALLDAWKDEVYAGVYAEGVSASYSGPLEGLAARMPRHPVVLGDGLHRYRERIQLLWPEAELLEVDLFLAAPLGRLAGPMLGAGQGHGPEALTPLYIRGADIRLPSP